MQTIVGAVPRRIDQFVACHRLVHAGQQLGKPDLRVRIAGKPGALDSCLLQAHPELVDRYEHFWLPDDDLVADTATIDRMFDFARAYRLALAQPALTRNSYYTWPLLLQDARYQLRYTRFVEVMAPLFDRDALRTCLPTFTESTSGWGLDSVWPRLLADRGEQAMAIIEAASLVPE